MLVVLDVAQPVTAAAVVILLVMVVVVVVVIFDYDVNGGESGCKVCQM